MLINIIPHLFVIEAPVTSLFTCFYDLSIECGNCSDSVVFLFFCGIMVSVLAWSAVYRGFEPRLVKTKDYKIGNHASLTRKIKNWLAGNQWYVPCGAPYLSADCFSELAL